MQTEKTKYRTNVLQDAGESKNNVSADGEPCKNKLPQTICYETCSHGRIKVKSERMTRCGICMVLFHNSCAGVDIEHTSKNWNCNQCRVISTDILSIKSILSEIQRDQRAQTDSMLAFNEALTTIVDNNFCLAKLISEQQNEIKCLKKENLHLVNQLKGLRQTRELNEMPLHQEKMNPNDETFFPPPTGKVVKTQNTVKSSNDEYPHRSGEQPVLKPWNDEEKCIPSITFIGSHVETGEIREIPEWHRIQELSEEIRKVSSPTLVFHCGSKNALSERAHVTINRIKRLEIIIKYNPCIKNVVISGLVPLGDSYDHFRRSELINETYKLICESNKWIYIDNANISNLTKDGWNLNEKGTLQLLDKIKNGLLLQLSNAEGFTLTKQGQTR